MIIYKNNACENMNKIPKKAKVYGSIKYSDRTITYYEINGEVFKIDNKLYPVPVKLGLIERIGLKEVFGIKN